MLASPQEFCCLPLLTGEQGACVGGISTVAKGPKEGRCLHLYNGDKALLLYSVVRENITHIRASTSPVKIIYLSLADY